MNLDLSTVHLPVEVVSTERLVLRPYRPDDAAAVVRACQDPDIQRWLGNLPSPYTTEDAETFVNDVAQRGRAAGTGMIAAIEAGDRFVGSSGLQRLEDTRMGPEIGYWVAPWARGHGYAAETTSGLAQWAFAHGAPRVHLFADVDNVASQAVARRAGFTEEGLLRSCLPNPDGSRGDALLFARLSQP